MLDFSSKSPSTSFRGIQAPSLRSGPNISPYGAFQALRAGSRSASVQRTSGNVRSPSAPLSRHSRRACVPHLDFPGLDSDHPSSTTRPSRSPPAFPGRSAPFIAPTIFGATESFRRAGE